MKDDNETYKSNMRGEPIGNWADRGIRWTTDRTNSTIELVDMIKMLTVQNKLAITALQQVVKTGDVMYAVTALDLIEEEREL